MQETWVQSLGQEDPLEKEMAAHSSILVWEIPWTESLVGYIGLQRLSDSTSTVVDLQCCVSFWCTAK